jgi:cytochrome oxidase assembly protein ShyY1
MNLHALTFSIIMIAVGLWQFRRAGRLARLNAELDAATPEERRSWDALGYPSTRPKWVRLTGAAMIAAGVAAAVAPMVI